MIGFMKTLNVQTHVDYSEYRPSTCERSVGGLHNTSAYSEGLERDMLGKDPSWNRGILNQYMAAISGSMAFSLMGAAMAWPSPTLVQMAQHEAPLTLDVSEITWMVSLMFLGHIIIPIPSGYLMECFGRKRACLWLVTLPIMSWLLILVATSAVHLYVARVLVGMWIGAISTITPVYVGEVAGPLIRNSLTTFNNLFLNFGVMYVYIIGPFVSYYMLAISCEILTLVFFGMFVFMPESPYYLIKQNRRSDALEVMSWLRQGETRESIESEINRIEMAFEAKDTKKATYSDLFNDKGNRKALIIAVVYAISKRSAGSGVMEAYTSITLPQVSFGILSPNICVIIIGVVSLVSCLFSTGLALKFRRRMLLTISCAGCAISTGSIGIWFYLNDFTTIPVDSCSDIIFMSIVLYYAMYNIAFGPIGTSINGELFAPSVKPLSSSLTTIFAAVTGFCVNKFYLIVKYSLGMYVNYILFCVSSIIAIVFTWTYLPDTHNKNLEEVQEILRGKKKDDNISKS